MPAVSGPDRPPFPGVPPEVPFPPGPDRPDPWPPTPSTPPTPAVPVVPVPDDLRSRVYDELLSRRTVLLDRPLETETAMWVSAQVIALDADGDGPIELIVNSPGGPLDAAAALLDTMDVARSPINTVCLGQATGTAAVVVAAGTGRRRAGATARLQLRLPEAAVAGTATRLADEVASLRQLHDATIDRLAAVTGQTRQLIERDVERGRVLAGEQAVAYGLVDEVASRTARGES
jgi:ATP-dependent Clp protease, protease subunit